MRRLFCILLLVIFSIWPKAADAAEVTMNFLRQDDGIACGEFWYNGKVIWRVMLLTDGAKPVSAGNGSTTTFLMPDIINGCFVLKIQ